jgi:hypothetical protein
VITRAVSNQSVLDRASEHRPAFPLHFPSYPCQFFCTSPHSVLARQGTVQSYQKRHPSIPPYPKFSARRVFIAAIPPLTNRKFSLSIKLPKIFRFPDRLSTNIRNVPIVRTRARRQRQWQCQWPYQWQWLILQRIFQRQRYAL